MAPLLLPLHAAEAKIGKAMNNTQLAKKFRNDVLTTINPENNAKIWLVYCTPPGNVKRQ
jgi:hypothetical protein